VQTNGGQQNGAVQTAAPSKTKDSAVVQQTSPVKKQQTNGGQQSGAVQTAAPSKTKDSAAVQQTSPVKKQQSNSVVQQSAPAYVMPGNVAGQKPRAHPWASGLHAQPTKKPPPPTTNVAQPSVKQTSVAGSGANGPRDGKKVLRGAGGDERWTTRAMALRKARDRLRADDDERTHLSARLRLVDAVISCAPQGLITGEAVDDAMAAIVRGARANGKTVDFLTTSEANTLRLTGVSFPTPRGLLLIPVCGADHWLLASTNRRCPNILAVHDSNWDAGGLNHDIIDPFVPAFRRSLGEGVEIRAEECRQQAIGSNDCAVRMLVMASALVREPTTWTREMLATRMQDAYLRATLLHRAWCVTNGRVFMNADTVVKPTVAETNAANRIARRSTAAADNDGDDDDDDDDERSDDSDDEDVMLNPPDGYASDFPSSSVAPPDAARMTWEDLMLKHGLKLVDAVDECVWVTRIARDNLAKQTRKGHLAILKRVITEMPAEFQKLKLATAIIQQVQRTAKVRGWAEQTAHRVLCSTQGAFASLPMYSNAPWSIHLQSSVDWKHAVKKSAKKANVSAMVNCPVALSLTTYTTCLAQLAKNNSEAARKTAAMLALTWRTCARLGCVKQLQREDVVFGGTAAARTCCVTFVRGKGVEFRKPYSVFAALSCEEAVWLEEVHTHTRPRCFLFQATSAVEARDALRAVDPHMTQRSIRRGALQHLALFTDKPTLMQFSGHTSVQTLNRYLGWGSTPTDEAKRAIDAARAAMSVPPL
jgi:hypothetical protein